MADFFLYIVCNYNKQNSCLDTGINPPWKLVEMVYGGFIHVSKHEVWLLQSIIDYMNTRINSPWKCESMCLDARINPPCTFPLISMADLFLYPNTNFACCSYKLVQEKTRHAHFHPFLWQIYSCIQTTILFAVTNLQYMHTRINSPWKCVWKSRFSVMFFSPTFQSHFSTLFLSKINLF